jgi:hypothetical protein
MTDAATAADDNEKGVHPMDTLGGLDPVDLDALQRCVEHMLADRELGGLVRETLRERPWIDVARFCAFAAQMAALQLRPYQPPPCWGGDPDADGLADRLRAAGLSRFEPDPAAALAAKERPKRR